MDAGVNVKGGGKKKKEFNIEITEATEKGEEKNLARRKKKIPTKLARKARQILVLLMDVDGTLTDGSVTLVSQSDGSALEAKTFDAHDGQGLTLAVTAGLRTGVITGRGSAALHPGAPAAGRRVDPNGIPPVYWPSDPLRGWSSLPRGGPPGPREWRTPCRPSW